MGLGAGVAVTVLVTLRLAWQAGRVSPLTALKTETAGERRARPYERWGLIGGARYGYLG